MKYRVVLTNEAAEDYDKLTLAHKKKLQADFVVIQECGIDAVYVKRIYVKDPEIDKLFEIRTDHIRSLFVYLENQVVLISLVFIKQSQKTPEKHIQQALRRIKKYDQSK